MMDVIVVCIELFDIRTSTGGVMQLSVTFLYVKKYFAP